MSKNWQSLGSNLFLSLLTSHFKKLFIACLFSGLAFGYFSLKSYHFLAGKKPLLGDGEVSKSSKKLAEANFQVGKLSYYQVLNKRPKTEPDGAVKGSRTLPVLALPTQQVLQKRDEATFSKELSVAIVKSLEKRSPNVVKKVEETLPNTTGSPFAIQLASFPSLETARNYWLQLRKKGFVNAKIVQAEIVGQGIVFRVRLHGFFTKSEAEVFMKKNGLEGDLIAQ